MSRFIVYPASFKLSGDRVTRFIWYKIDRVYLSYFWFEYPVAKFLKSDQNYAIRWNRVDGLSYCLYCVAKLSGIVLYPSSLNRRISLQSFEKIYIYIITISR